MLTDNEFPRLDKLQLYPKLHPQYQKIKNLWVASPFMKAQAAKYFPEAKIIYLPNLMPHLDSLSFTDRGSKLCFVNPVPVKGLEFMLRFARAMPKEQFLFVGNWDAEAPQNLTANISYRPRQESLNEIFAQSEILLVPSLWEEGFGRVVLEALAQGLGVVVSPKGNLPNTLGGAGIVAELELGLWESALNTIRTQRDEFRKRGKKRVQNYRQEAQLAFDEFFRSL
jgi:glycosyltransferase involved in cell wall biosynthesis